MVEDCVLAECNVRDSLSESAPVSGLYLVKGSVH